MRRLHEVTLLLLWPGSSLHFLDAMSEVRTDDWHIEYYDNRFARLGNGLSQTEVFPGGDLSYYLRNGDDSSFLSNAKRVNIMNNIMTDILSDGPVVLGKDGVPLVLDI